MIRNFIKEYGLQPGDAIIAKKRLVGVFDHFIVYMGIYSGNYLFIANDATGGVKWFSEYEVAALVPNFEPVRVRKFEGNFVQRQWALTRAKEEIGKKYDLFNFNCEHLANYIQYGIRESKQVQGWGNLAAIVAGVFIVGAILND
jgi:hypothetical protein